MAKEEVGRKFSTFGTIRLIQTKGEIEKRREKERDEKMRKKKENEKEMKWRANKGRNALDKGEKGESQQERKEKKSDRERREIKREIFSAFCNRSSTVRGESRSTHHELRVGTKILEFR